MTKRRIEVSEESENDDGSIGECVEDQSLDADVQTADNIAELMRKIQRTVMFFLQITHEK